MEIQRTSFSILFSEIFGEEEIYKNYRKYAMFEEH